MLNSLFGHLNKPQANRPESIKVVWRWLQRARLLSALVPTSTLCQPQKSLSATWCMKAHCLGIQLYMTPAPICTDAIWPQLPPSILACGVDSMNFYYAACVCHWVWLCRWSFSPPASPENTSLGSPRQTCSAIARRVFGFSLLKSEETGTADRTYWVCLFVF